ncbi:virulence-associated protein VapB [Polaromonas sp.]|uniref:antitoxin n=1 Tax=Polaromonas sp. TaxID=1869339 RepID=UPI001813E514|nr:virulence-associated protein VapB [Polaromonas sp.]NMM07126.1 virulence-associated protein VapB [Polaromonas sp.]
MPHASEKLPPHTAETPNDAKERHARLFRNGANQAVRIPREFELAGTETVMRKVGNTLVIEPVAVEYPRGSPQAFLQALDEIAKLGPCDEEFPDVDTGLLSLDDIVL